MPLTWEMRDVAAEVGLVSPDTIALPSRHRDTDTTADTLRDTDADPVSAAWVTFKSKMDSAARTSFQWASEWRIFAMRARRFQKIDQQRAVAASPILPIVAAYERAVVEAKGDTYSFPIEQWVVMARVIKAHCRDRAGQPLVGDVELEWVEAVVFNMTKSVLDSKDPKAITFGFGPKILESYLNKQHERAEAKAVP